MTTDAPYRVDGPLFLGDVLLLLVADRSHLMVPRIKTQFSVHVVPVVTRMARFYDLGIDRGTAIGRV